MLRVFVHGLLFGTGFGVAFAVVCLIVMFFIFPSLLGVRYGFSEDSMLSEHVVNKAPELSEAGVFLGSSGIYSGGFLDNKEGILSGGEGIIRGKALIDGQPLEGLKLRLALNGKVMSQWATSDERGIYRVSVPYGEYRVDGYELNASSANSVLPNRINHPENEHSTGPFQVAVEQLGNGLTLRFVEPVIKKSSKRSYSSGEAVILKWESYPKALAYRVQVYEKSDANAWKSEHVFDWSERPDVSTTELDLSKLNIDLKPGYFYAFEVEAIGANETLLSNTNRDYSGFDFEITE